MVLGYLYKLSIKNSKRGVSRNKVTCEEVDDSNKRAKGDTKRSIEKAKGM
jgi:hypothetical protein